ncbi:glycosyltransferase family 39 protein [Herbiconiux sp. 11R-BC]|uniref:ArnT family glycosyltransferase n=1 Tax=Herbiconiux sp. 11R-BC TaxID=3111637 RepID=UPI003C079E3A
MSHNPASDVRPGTAARRPVLPPVELAAGLALLLWGLYQSFWNLGAANYNADEPIYLQAGWAYVHGDFSLNREHPPTAKYLFGLVQVIGGEGALSGRVLVGVLTVLAGVIIYFWVRREFGWIGALAAAGFWLVLPHGVSSGVRIDRFALLEPVMVFFAIAGMAAAWRWFRTRSWWWLALSAVAMALSVTSKLSTIVLLPVVVLLPVLEKRWRDALLGAVVFLAIFAVVFVLVYLPLGIRSAIGYMIDFQRTHDTLGHPVVVGGDVYAHPPWWANLLFSVDGMGVVAVVVLLAGTVAAFFARRRQLPLYLGAAVALLWIFYLGVSAIALTHYYYAWVWLFCVLAGIGIAVLVAHARDRARTTATRILAAALLVLAAGCGAYTSVSIANERATGVALVVPALDDRGAPNGGILVAGMAPWEYSPYFAGRETTDASSATLVAVATKDSPRFPIDPAVTALLDSRAADFDVVQLDDVTLHILRSAETAR